MAGFTQAFLDALNEWLLMQRVDNTNTQDLTTVGAIKAALGDAVFSDLIPKGQLLKLRTIHFQDLNGAYQRIIGLVSNPQTDPNGGNQASAPNDIWLGGGGGDTLYKLQSVQGDYLTARTWDGTTLGSIDIYIAKDELHRNSISSATIEGVSHTYTYGAGGDANNVARTNQWTISGTAYSQIEEITRPWVTNEVIRAHTCNHTLVSVSGNPLTLIYSGPFRAWGKIA